MVDFETGSEKLVVDLNYFFEQFGARCTYNMLQASLGDFDGFLEACSEDVVVLAHCHHWKCKVVDSKMGELIYANAGTWIDIVKEVRALTTGQGLWLGIAPYFP